MKSQLFPLVLFLLIGGACQHKEKEIAVFDRDSTIAVMNSMVESPGQFEKLAAWMDRITESREISAAIISSAYLNRIPPCLMLAIAKVESNFFPLALHSNAGKSYDIGIFQLNSLTFKQYREEYLYSVPNNVRCAGDYLRELISMHGSWELCILSYNCGAINKNVPGQSVKYMQKILDIEQEYMASLYQEVIHGQD